jgi:orotidine-5'-phosphate decarboxylase
MVTEQAPPNQVGFAASVLARMTAVQSRLCVGLDPDPRYLPDGFDNGPEDALRFCLDIVEAISDLTAAFKVNFAFFEALGPEGWEAIARLRAEIPAGIPVIADAKRGDIGNTSRAYAHAILGAQNFDAITVNPYLGWDSLAPFFDFGGKGVFVLCKTSNPGSADLQDLTVEGEPVYERVAREAVAREAAADIGLVVGGTHPGALCRVRHIAPHTLLLVPGVGVQGGSVSSVMEAAGKNVLVAVSRDILYASRAADYAGAARRKAAALARETWVEGD